MVASVSFEVKVSKISKASNEQNCKICCEYILLTEHDVLLSFFVRMYLVNLTKAGFYSASSLLNIFLMCCKLRL